ncbi:hypothetical protein K435DRAFT_784150 [Dendrothele bispora CBS 962.96]|uniref:Uncharacterized protein n=1 Tax=Dendrothele bispora (strain CBS 962.96) TaxID=1314807 RepID=A0A4S8KWP6_DENBC|nr:hypothetical protein K435DRAFT_785505 [Dendrothele bispora CBS 962.96]THU83509.1 hypothetical protein K435DRAFT_784150 [Dendrothele bispora CBS 962.96]
MFALRVQFPQNWPGWRVPEYFLNESSDVDISSSRREQHGKQIVVTTTVESEMHSDYCSDSPVFRGYIRDADCKKLLSSYALPPMPTTTAASSAKTTCPTSSASIPVALKFAMREDLMEDLAQEAAVYLGPLKSLQGKTIPRCFGFYTGLGEEGQEIACLMLEYWGEGLRTSFSALPLDLRLKTLERLRELHRCGVHHGDFAERNVLQQNGDVRLIDFDQVEGIECDCTANFDFCCVGSAPPDMDKVGCSILWEIGWDMGIWEDMEEEETSESESSDSSGFGAFTSSRSTPASELDFGNGLTDKLAKDLSLDDGREG